MLFNYATKEITLKVVYYGPGLGGKTTNLQQIHARLNPETRGKLLSLSTESDRTLFFDFLPMELGTIQGFRVRFQLYTVPGQVYYNATRKLVLKGADGVVFVADSQEAAMERNLESLQNLRDNLLANALDPDTIPMVMQYNKRDLPQIASVEELNARLNARGVPAFEAVATEGRGVVETFKAMAKLLIHDLRQKVAEGPRSAAPEEAVAEAKGKVPEAAPISLADALQESAAAASSAAGPEAPPAESPVSVAAPPASDETRLRELVRAETASTEVQIARFQERLDRLEESLKALQNTCQELSQNLQRLFQLMGETQGKNLAVQDEFRTALQKQEQALEELRSQLGRSWFRSRRTSL